MPYDFIIPESEETEKGGEHEDNNSETSPMQTAEGEAENPSSQGYSTVRFEDMLIEVINPSALYIDWCPVINCDNLHGYKIRYSIKDNSSYNEVFVTAGISNYTVTGLKPATEYVISVNAIDEYEQVIKQCGQATQRTDEYVGKLSGSSPYIAFIVAAMLLTVALAIPLSILLITYERRGHFGAPNVTLVAGIMLLLVAVVVPITFLFLRKCGPCSDNSPGKQIAIIEQDKDDTTVTRKYATSNEIYAPIGQDSNISLTHIPSNR